MPNIDVSIQDTFNLKVDEIQGESISVDEQQGIDIGVTQNNTNISIEDVAANNVSVEQVAQSDVKVTALSSNTIKIGGAGSGDLHFVYSQTAPIDVWTITHNLDKKPSVTVVDSAETVVIGSVTYINSNSLRITFDGSFSGKAYLN